MRVRVFLASVLLQLTLGAPALAEAPLPSVWYRASEGCPAGAQFLQKLAETSRHARIAQAGDHIDFVVTLVTTGQETVGRLERQTNSGIVAIRELRDDTCERVADALALSLGLTLTPAAQVPEPLPEPAASDPLLLDVVSSAHPEPAPTPPGVPETIRTTASEPAATHPHAQGHRTSAWALGFEAGPMIGISTQPQPRAQAFADFRPATWRPLPNLSLRVGAVGMWGASGTPIGSVHRWILAGRVEGCPIAWRAARFDLRPCLGFELGATGASGQSESGIDDRGIWAAPGGQVRFSFALVPRRVWVELSGGALVPLTRNEIFSRSQSLYRDALGVFHAGLGFSLRLP